MSLALALALADAGGAAVPVDSGTLALTNAAQQIALAGGITQPGALVLTNAAQHISMTGDVETGVAGCVLLLDANKGITVTSGVSAWADQSGNGNNFTGVASHLPSYNGADPNYNSLASVQFSGAVPQYMTASALALSQPFTWIFVGALTGFGSTQIFLEDTAGLSMGGNTSGYYEYGGGSGTVQTSNKTTTPQVIAGIFNGTTSSVYINSSASAVASGSLVQTIAMSGAMAIGATTTGTQPMTGTLAQVRIYNSALSTANLSQIFQYLGNRYGQSWS